MASSPIPTATATATAPAVQGAAHRDLFDLLDAGLAFDHATRNGLSNHLPMVLSALDRLGADRTTLQDHAAGFAQRGALARRDPQQLAARRDDVDRLGIDEAVRRHADALLDAPGAGWFHALIRLAYGIEVRHHGEVAAGLVYGADAAVRPTVAPPRGGTAHLDEVLGNLRSWPELTSDAGWPFDEVMARPGFAEITDRIALDGSTLDDVAATVLTLHVSGDNFGTLHLVTGTHAARILVGVLAADQVDRFTARFAQAVAAAFLASGAPPLPTPQELARFGNQVTPRWDTIAELAVTSRDAHVIKLTDVCRVEGDRTGDDLYRTVAARANGLL